MTTPDAALPRRRSPGRRLREALIPLLWIGPALALIAVIVLWPVVVLFRTSFEHISPDGFVFGSAGGKNFSNLFDEPDLHGVLIRTVIWVGAIGRRHDADLDGPGTAVQCAMAGPAGRALGNDRAVGCIGHDDLADFLRWALNDDSGVINVFLHQLGLVQHTTRTVRTGLAGRGRRSPG